jgi:hypothetical protein
LLFFDNRVAEAIGTKIPYTCAKIILVEQRKEILKLISQLMLLVSKVIEQTNISFYNIKNVQPWNLVG